MVIKMDNKIKIASLRPSPFASLAGIFILIAFLIFGIFFMADIPAEGEIFRVIWALVCIGGIIYFLVNLATFTKANKERIPVTAGEVIEIVEDKEEAKGDFEARLRKLESLRKDKLISEEEYKTKRKEIMEEKW